VPRPRPRHRRSAAAQSGRRSTVPQTAPGYLDDARRAGLLFHLRDAAYTADTYRDPVTGVRSALVEHCDERIAADPGRLAELCDRLRADVGTILLRVDGASTTLPPPWQPHLTYVRFAGRPPTDVAPRVRVAGAQHRHAIAGWLARAFQAAADEQGHPADDANNLALAEQVLDSADSESYVFVARGRAVGHATLIRDAYDAVTARSFVELLDVLVEPWADVRGSTPALVAACARRAAQLGLPLIGHVVHPAGAAKGERIVASLLAAGWVVDHRFWRRDLEGTARAPRD
jgi:hypothetical protein